MKSTIAICAAFLLAMVTTAAQEKPSAPLAPPAPVANDTPHTHHAMGHGGFMQGDMHHAMATGVKLEEKLDAATHTITLRIGPMTLPAHTNHMKMPQPPDLVWSVPMNAWLLAYHPKLVDPSGATVPGTVLHHVAFWNENRADFLCPNKEEHIFGAGSEMTDWAEVPGYGYRVQKGDKIRIETMIHNPTDTGHDGVYLEVAIPFQDLNALPNAAAARKSVYPAWMDVESCGNSGYDLKPGHTVTIGTVPVNYDGVLLGVGGHLHDYGRQVLLQDVSRKETVATLDAKVGEQGQLLAMPTKLFLDEGGYKFAAGDVLKISATYDNPTGKLLRDGAMSIAVGYFLPTDDAVMAALRRTPNPPPHSMAGMTHDH